MKKSLVVLTGAGISAESGIQTFRDADGLWAGYKISDVATPEAWLKNPNLVQDFYNERRKQILAAQPNAAHMQLAALEEFFKVTIITQNIDDLHERAGSEDIIHLHGIITKSQSDVDASRTYPISGWELKSGAFCEYGKQLRPHVVWFGEDVPMIEMAAKVCNKADLFMVVGTSLAVYPAAGLLDFVADEVVKYIIDPKIPSTRAYKNIIAIEEKATTGMQAVLPVLMQHV